MSGPPRLSLPRKSFVAVLLVLICALFFQAWWAIEMTPQVFSRDHAINLTRLVILPLLVVLVWLILRKEQNFLRALFTLKDFRPRLAVAAILVGILARVLYWSVIVAATALGITGKPHSVLGSGPDFVVGCAPPLVMLTGALVWLVLVPFAEEFIHRGVILSALAERGKLLAILLSAIIFTLCHQPGSYLLVFCFGLVFGLQYWNSGSIWYPMLTHAVFDGFILVDFYCVKVLWNPAHRQLPVFLPSAIAILTALFCVASILLLISKRWTAPAKTRSAGRLT